MTSRTWTNEEDEVLIAMRRDGHLLREVATRLARSLGSVTGRQHILLAEDRLVYMSKDELASRRLVVRERRTTKLKARAAGLMANIPNTRDVGYVIGVLYGDGFINFRNATRRIAKSIGLSTTDESFRESFVQALESWVGGRVKRGEHMVDAVIAPFNRVYHNVHYFDAWLHDRYLATAVHNAFGPTQTDTWKIDVDGALARSPEFARGVLQGLFDSDGSVCVSERGASMKIGTVSVDGALSAFRLASALGYDAMMSSRIEDRYKRFFSVSLTAVGARRYAAEVSSRIDYKRERMERYLASRFGLGRRTRRTL